MTEYELALDNSIKELDELYEKVNATQNGLRELDYSVIEKSPSSLDAWDYCFSIAIGMAGAFITTNEELGNYLKDIHDAASGVSGEYSALQAFLGKLLYHKGDAIDKIPGEKAFLNRDLDNAYGLFHRLLWGHDLLDFGPDNPFKLMVDQKGIMGVLQVLRHLIADTMSKQGLPMPGSSFLDYHKTEDGKLSNYLIKISQELSMSSTGKKNSAQEIYAHMFTVRAQDIVGGGAVTLLVSLYEKIRGIKDSLRNVQLRLVSLSVAFFGQAIIGATRQAGVPYVNVPLFAGVMKNLVQLYYLSIKETRQLHDKTVKLIDAGSVLCDEVECSGKDIPSYEDGEDYITELENEEKNVGSLIQYLEGRMI